MKLLGASLSALLILAACDQAEAIGSAVGPCKAIAELKYAGDRELEMSANGSRLGVYTFRCNAELHRRVA